jgi:hypothetical protein
MSVTYLALDWSPVIGLRLRREQLQAQLLALSASRFENQVQQTLSDVALLHLAGNILGLPDCESHDRQRRILGGAGSELTPIGNE